MFWETSEFSRAMWWIGESVEVLYKFKKRVSVNNVKKMENPMNDFTVLQLKDLLKAIYQSTAGTKQELFCRLIAANPNREWLDQNGRLPRKEYLHHSPAAEGAYQHVTSGQREIDLYRREKELTERKLELAQREIQLLRRQVPKPNGLPRPQRVHNP